MKRLLALIFFLFSLFTCSFAGDPVKQLRMDIDSLVTKDYTTTVTKAKTVKTGRGRRAKTKTVYTKQTVRRTFDIGCVIYDLTADSLLYSRNPYQMMIPASTQKLFTVATRLSLLRDNISVGSQDSFEENVAVNDGETAVSDDDIMDIADIPTDSLEENSELFILQELGIDIENWGYTIDEEGHVSRVDAVQTQEKTAVDKADVAAGPTEEAEKGLYKVSGEALALILKRSNNAEAEAMLRGVVRKDSLWHYDNCLKMVRELVGHVRKTYHPDDYKANGINGYYTIKDGSGLSHGNKVTAQTEVDLLRYIYDNDAIYYVMHEYMPVAGVDGTLAKRMQGTSSYNNVHAKTGTVNAVTTLAGYATTADGHRLCFSILMNRCNDIAFGRQLQNKICNLMTDMRFQ